jgi:alpha/beta superfamily hydrolase|tara:strand:- start:697 stop:1194 length:498 start_codon:yes stop_codon:yes gene_type:complete
MFDAVLDTVEQALTPMNLRTLRFNFRGVGSSEGEYDNGEGEVNDLLSVVEWLRQAKNPSILSVAGYSFGSVVASRGVANNNTVSRVVLVAPPTSSMALANDLTLPVRIIVGDADPFVDLPQLQQWQHDQTDAEIMTIPGADHFFDGQHEALQSATSAIFSEAPPP